MRKQEREFTAIYESHKEKVYKQALRLTGYHWYAEEIVQEVFLKLWQQWQKENTIDNISSYIFTICRNQCINFMRKRKRSMKLVANNASALDRYWLEDELCRKEMRKTVMEAVKRLPKRQRQAYSLRWLGLKNKATGLILGITAETVKNHLEKANRSVMQHVIAKWEAPEKMKKEYCMRA